MCSCVWYFVYAWALQCVPDVGMRVIKGSFISEWFTRQFLHRCVCRLTHAALNSLSLNLCVCISSGMAGKMKE